MTQILRIREVLIQIYKHVEFIVLFILRFLVGLYVFNWIDKIGEPMGKVADVLAPVLAPDRSTLFLVLLALIFAVLPMTFSYALIVLDIGLQMSGVLLVAVVVMLVLFVIMAFYVRLAPRENMLILAMVLAYHFHLPYLIPLIAGMYFGLTSIIPIAIGVFVWQYIPITKDLMTSTANIEISLDSIGELPAVFGGFYDTIIETFKANTDWIVLSFVFAMTVLVVNAVSRLSFKFAKEVAIVGGAFFGFILLIIVNLASNIEVNTLGALGSTLLSILIMLVIRFFDAVLDYSRVESVHFQDEDNVYYVKIIPKMTALEPMRREPVRTPPTSERGREHSTERDRYTVNHFNEDDWTEE